MKVIEESEKSGLKLNIQNATIMASGSITSWQIVEEKVETVTYFILLGSQITAVGDYSHEIKRCLLLGRKAMTNLDSILKSRDITLPTQVHVVKAMVYPVVMYGCESWTMKKSEHRRTDAFKLVLEKTLESPLDSKEIKPVSPKGNKPWKRSGWQRIKWLDWHHQLDRHESEQVPGVGDGQGSLACFSPWVTKSRTRLSNWTTATSFPSLCFLTCKILIMNGLD